MKLVGVSQMILNIFRTLILNKQSGGFQPTLRTTTWLNEMGFFEYLSTINI